VCCAAPIAPGGSSSRSRSSNVAPVSRAIVCSVVLGKT
jgi:hypothetical protein